MPLQQPTTMFRVSPDSAAYAAILRQGPTALAWEVLRRDPAYRLAYEQRQALDLAGTAASHDFVTRWGPHFR